MSASRGRSLRRFALLVAVCALALQLYFVARIALMALVDPASTTFQRSEAWRLALAPGEHGWHQQWSDYGRISPALKRAVIASEDSGFTEHSGVEWDALEKAWEKNERADAIAARAAQRAQRREPAAAAKSAPRAAGEGRRRLDHHASSSRRTCS